MRIAKAPPALLTVEQVAERLHVSKKTVGEMYRTGELPHVRIGPKQRWIRIDPRDLEQYIETRRYTQPL